MTLKNKHAVVTGGGSGVGEAIALKLAENSSLVTILGRRDKPLKKVSAKHKNINWSCLLYTSPSPRDQRGSRMPSSA